MLVCSTKAYTLSSILPHLMLSLPAHLLCQHPEESFTFSPGTLEQKTAMTSWWLLLKIKFTQKMHCQQARCQVTAVSWWVIHHQEGYPTQIKATKSHTPGNKWKYASSYEVFTGIFHTGSVASYSSLLCFFFKETCRIWRFQKIMIGHI